MNKFRYLLVSDLDGTLLGDDAELQQFGNWITPRRNEIGLVYSSGRLLPNMRECVASTHLPEPDFLVGGVGTQIFDYQQQTDLNEWTDYFTDWDHLEVLKVMSQFSMLEYQPARLQTEYKVSYYGHNLSPLELVEMEAALQKSGLKAHIVYSSSRDLDVLPLKSGKGNAANFLAQLLNLEISQTIGAGDTGNDLSLLKQSGRGIVVANAQPELKSYQPEHVYHSSHSYAAGVLDGLKYWLNK